MIYFTGDTHGEISRFKTNSAKKIKKGDIVFGYGIGNMHLWKILIFLIHKKKGFYVSELCELPYGTSIETPESIKNREYLYKHLKYIFHLLFLFLDLLIYF